MGVGEGGEEGEGEMGGEGRGKTYVVGLLG